jgi:hypothetical protein
VPKVLASRKMPDPSHQFETVRKDDEGHRTFNLQLDLPELEKTIDRLDDVRLVIIDPITSYHREVRGQPRVREPRASDKRRLPEAVEVDLSRLRRSAA